MHWEKKRKRKKVNVFRFNLFISFFLISPSPCLTHIGPMNLLFLTHTHASLKDISDLRSVIVVLSPCKICSYRASARNRLHLDALILNDVRWCRSVVYIAVLRFNIVSPSSTTGQRHRIHRHDFNDSICCVVCLAYGEIKQKRTTIYGLMLMMMHCAYLLYRTGLISDLQRLQGTDRTETRDEKNWPEMWCVCLYRI